MGLNEICLSLISLALTINDHHFIRRSKLNAQMLGCKEWETIIEVLLQFATRSPEVIKIVVLLLAMKPPSSVLEYRWFMS